MASRNSGGGSAEKRSRNHEEEKRGAEVVGVLWIAAGILAAAYLFFSAAGYLGEMLGKALFGLFGIVAYALPVILIGVGVVYIRGNSNRKLGGSGWAAVLGTFSLVALLQVTRSASYDGVTYMNFINEAFTAGQTARVGGGFVGAVLSYPLLLLGGKMLAYVITIALMLVCIIIVTGFSIRRAGEKLTNSVQNAIENTREERREAAEKPMFTLTLEDEKPPSEKTGKRGKKRRKTVAAAGTDSLDYAPFSGDLRTKTGEKPRRRKPEPVKTDIWDNVDFEPSDDVPFDVTPARGGKKPAPAALPDPTPLFGAQSHSMSGKPLGTPRQKTKAAGVLPFPEKQKTQPEVLFSDGAAYRPPSTDLLNKPGASKNEETIPPEEKARIIISTLASFNIPAHVTNISVGPALTRIEIQPAPGIRISRITSLTNNITMALAAPRLRMEAPIPGKNAIGIEVPNKNSALVVLRDIVESREFRTSASPVTMAFGKEASGKIIVADLTRMPHMLIAGATGSGKSVCINDIIVSMLYKSSPADLRFVLIDPKMVEMTIYGSLPHLLMPVVTESKKAAGALRWAVREMTSRYKLFSESSAKNIDRFNEQRARTHGEHLPRIVIIIDEFADLMMIAPEDVEDSIRRIAQLGRAAGIHLILATQRPDATVITGLIKANIPSRAAFAVSSATNSRIILDMGGAEKLLGNGDMLFHPDGSAKPTRLQCAYVSEDEIARIVEYFETRAEKPAFDQRVLEDVSTFEKSGPTGGVFGEGKQEDDLLGEAVRVVLEHGQASTSMIQRRLRVGYARASRLIDIMEQKGYVSGFNGSKAREVLIKRAQYEQLFGDGTPLAAPPGSGGGDGMRTE